MDTSICSQCSLFWHNKNTIKNIQFYCMHSRKRMICYGNIGVYWSGSFSLCAWSTSISSSDASPRNLLAFLNMATSRAPPITTVGRARAPITTLACITMWSRWGGVTSMGMQTMISSTAAARLNKRLSEILALCWLYGRASA